MIRRRWGPNKWMLVAQTEHARLSGVMAAALWLAVAVHDALLVIRTGIVG